MESVLSSSGVLVSAGIVVMSVNENVVSIEFSTSYLGILYESYTMELSLTDAGPPTVLRHDLPYFVPVQQMATNYSTVAKETSSSCELFVWAIYRYLHAFVARRQESMLVPVCLAR